MRKTILLTITFLFLTTSCSNNEDNYHNTTITGEWEYKEDINHDLYDLTNKDNYKPLYSALQLCSNIPCEIGNTIVDKYQYQKNLCEKNNHEYCIELNLSFENDKCIYTETKYKLFQDITKTTSTTKYTFKEGCYTCLDGVTAEGYGRYVGVDVYAYGIYKAVHNSSSGKILIALDGNFAYNLTYTNYKSYVVKSDISVSTETYNYIVDGNKIW